MSPIGKVQSESSPDWRRVGEQHSPVAWVFGTPERGADGLGEGRRGRLVYSPPVTPRNRA